MHISFSQPVRISDYLWQEMGKNIPESDEAYFRPV